MGVPIKCFQHKDLGKYFNRFWKETLVNFSVLMNILLDFFSFFPPPFPLPFVDI